jgi:hypothetical protein
MLHPKHLQWFSNRLYITGLVATSPVSHLPFLVSHLAHLLLTATFHTLLEFICDFGSVLSPFLLQLHSAKWEEGSAQMSPTPEIFNLLNLGLVFIFMTPLFLWTYVLLYSPQSLYIKFSDYSVSSVRTQFVLKLIFVSIGTTVIY